MANLSNFSTDGEWGTLRPYRSGLHFRIPSWVALIIAVPLLVLCAAAFVAHSLPAQLLFGVPGALFLVLWFISRRVSRDFGLVRINQRTKVGVFTTRDGSENTVHFGQFQSIKIERVLVGHMYSWMAVLCGDSGNLILEMGYSFQRPLIKRMSPVATWLGIPVEVSDRKIYLTDWLSKPDFRTNPYPLPGKKGPGSIFTLTIPPSAGR